MSMEANRFRLGVFFFTTGILFVSILIWLTGWFKSEETCEYLCYFAESVQGLETGSSVRFNGVPVGTVDRIAVAPDGRLVEVMTRIDTDFPVDTDIAARLDFVGITGIRIINLRLADADQIETPFLAFEPKYPVIPVQKSQLERLDIGLQNLLEFMTDLDIAEISDLTIRTLHSMNNLLNSEDLTGLLHNANRTSSRLDSLILIYTELGTRANKLADQMSTEAPTVAEEIGTLVENLSALTASYHTLSYDAGAIVAEAGKLLRDLRLLINHLQEHPEEFLVEPRKEDVWP